MIASGSERSVRTKPARSSAHAVAEPGGRRLGADEAEQTRSTSTVRRSPVGVCSSVTWLEVVVAGERAHLGVRAARRCGRRPRCARSGSATSSPPSVSRRIDERHVALLLRQVDRGLAGRVAAARRRSRRSRRRCALRGRSPRSRRPRLRSARGRRPRGAGSARPTRRSPRGVGISLPSAEHDHVEAVLDAQAGDLARRVEPRAEPHGLDRGALREVFARDAVREADVVLDARARRRPGRRSRPRRARSCRALPTRRTPRPRGRPARCRRRRDRRRTRASAWNVRPRCSANSPGVGRRSTPVGVTTTGVSLGRTPRLASSTAGVVDVFEVDPGVRETRAVRERAQRHRLGRVARADDADRARAFARTQELAARDERAEDHVGELGLACSSAGGTSARSIARTRPGLRHARGEVRALAGEQVELAEEAARRRASRRRRRRRCRGGRSRPRLRARRRSRSRRRRRGRAPRRPRPRARRRTARARRAPARSASHSSRVLGVERCVVGADHRRRSGYVAHQILRSRDARGCTSRRTGSAARRAGRGRGCRRASPRASSLAEAVMLELREHLGVQSTIRVGPRPVGREPGERRRRRRSRTAAGRRCRPPARGLLPSVRHPASLTDASHDPHVVWSATHRGPDPLGAWVVDGAGEE